jgi:hypothetical protein
VALVLALEVALRFLPVADTARRQPVDAEHPVLRLEPSRTLTYSRDWNLRRVIEHHVNNDGFYHAHDYDAGATTPLVAIVGDSYVEASMLPFDRSLAGRLTATFADAARFYTFAISGVALSHYLVYARHARDTYRPDRLVVVVVSNDFDASMSRWGRFPGYWVFEEDASGELVLSVTDYHPARLQVWFRHSALARYLLLNLKILSIDRLLWNRVGTGEGEGEPWIANVDRHVGPERLRASERAVETFLERVPEAAGLAPDEILFVLDAVRPQVYEPGGMERVADSYAVRMREHFIPRAREAGFEVADLQPRFAAGHAADGRRFEFEDDNHWNAAGHEEVARAILESEIVGSLLRERGIARPALAP